MTGCVTGIGGIFFRAKDSKALTAWYMEHLGIPSYEYWPQPSGNAVFAPFKADTDYFPAGKQWMINLRVEGLDALSEKLENAGIPVDTSPQEGDDPQYGKFARIIDPEGNHIELWEPAE